MDPVSRALPQNLRKIFVATLGLEIQVNHILNDYCSQSPNADNCAAFVPDFWKAIAMQLWPEAWSHLCQDIAETCESGVVYNWPVANARIDWALSTLVDPAVEAYWVRKLAEYGFCSDNYSEVEEICMGHLKDVFPRLLHVMGQKAWVPAFCSDFGCQAWEYGSSVPKYDLTYTRCPQKNTS